MSTQPTLVVTGAPVIIPQGPQGVGVRSVRQVADKIELTMTDNTVSTVPFPGCPAAAVSVWTDDVGSAPIWLYNDMGRTCKVLAIRVVASAPAVGGTATLRCEVQNGPTVDYPMTLSGVVVEPSFQLLSGQGVKCTLRYPPTTESLMRQVTTTMWLSPVS